MSARILVIEDDEGILKFLRRGLAYEGYQVDVATDGQTGLIFWTCFCIPISVCIMKSF